MLLLLTTILVVSAYYCKDDPTLVVSVYFVSVTSFKIFVCTNLGEVFNLEKTRTIYRNIGIYDSAISFLSISIMFCYYCLGSSKEMSLIRLWILVPGILFYRFLFWDLETIIKDRYM